MFRRLRRLLCRHDFINVGGPVCIGVTLGWSMMPARYWAQCKVCRCGKSEVDRFVYSGHYRDPPVSKGGWPLDAKGQKLRIAA
jgi:hypothetical protein